MSNWRMNGAGEDPVAFYAEVEPRIRKVAAAFSARLPDCKDEKQRKDLRSEFLSQFSELVGQRRQHRDVDAALAASPLAEGCEVGVCGVAVILAAMPKSGDKRNRLYHWGAGDTIMDALVESSSCS